MGSETHTSVVSFTAAAGRRRPHACQRPDYDECDPHSAPGVGKRLKADHRRKRGSPREGK